MTALSAERLEQGREPEALPATYDAAVTDWERQRYFERI